MKRTRTLALLLAVLMCLSTFMMAACGDKPEDGKKDDPVTPGQKDDPQTPEKPGEKDDPEQPAKGPLTLYVATTGTAEGNGTEANPFASIEAARDYVRTLDKTGYSSVTVLVGEGTYRVQTLVFDAQDSGTETCPVTYKANGEVTIDAGVTLKASDFAAVTDSAVLARLSEQAQQSVVCLDLSKYGVGPNDYGKIYAIGSYNTAGKYDGDWVGGQYAELFYNDRRMTVARYPNEGWLNTGRVLAEGQGLESSTSNHQQREDWGILRNPSPDRYKIDASVAARMPSWQTFDGVWMFGYWYYDWADASTPIGDFNAEACEMSPKFVSLFGAKADAPFYFFNVFEELDTPGEWYLDRENALLYLWADGDFDNAEISLSLAVDPILTVDGADWLTFDGFETKGTRGDAIVTIGDHDTVQDCLVKCIGGNALKMTGYENLACRNEITRTGKGGITLVGGDRETLTPGNNIAENNLIHDWAEINLTYQPGVTLDGVGNICRHNEMFHCPHEAITFSGNNHVIEYNYVHEVVLLSSDAGAIYAGRHWDWYGTVIRYNYVSHLGSGDYTPCGIYLDDALSGIQIYGNLLVDVPGYALHLGGGRDLDVRNNIIVSSKRVEYQMIPIQYDDRVLEGLNGGWYGDVRDGANGMWGWLKDSPWQTETWKEAYPQMSRIKLDPDATDDPDFPAWPAYSTVTGNLLCSKNECLVAKSVGKYSTFDNNPQYHPWRIDFKTLFVDPDAGNYHLLPGCNVYKKLPDFEDLPIEEMGIQPGSGS